MFLTVLSTDGGPVGERERVLYANRMRALTGSKLVVVEEGAFYALLAPAMVPLRPLIAKRRGLVGIGNVRLDNREEVKRWGGAQQHPASDLDLVLEAYDMRGARCIPDILGDFAFVIYDPRTRGLVASRDAFGVRTLFIGERSRVFVLSSHLEPLHDREDLDEEFVADFLLGGDPGPERTIWADSRAVPQGAIVTAREGRITTDRYWTPHEFSILKKADEREQVGQFRLLFEEAVRARLTPEAEIWAELSGGLDSSSVVCMAHRLRTIGAVPKGIAGTVTLADDLGDGDERNYSRVVVEQCDLRNEIVLNPWPWQDDGQPPPRTDEPRAHYPYFARDRAVCDLVQGAGGNVLLGGWGADHYLYCSMLFMADALARGKPGSMLKLLMDWSVTERKSFWQMLLHDAVGPLLPALARQLLAPDRDKIPPWIEPAFARRTSLDKRLTSVRVAEAPRGRQFERDVANNLQELTRWLPRGSDERGLEPRYPFLYRPLVELGLRLPPPLRARPLAQKWILRNAMAGVLPEAVRLRPGKGGVDARLLWALSRERQRLDDITRAPALASVGFVQAKHLRAAVEDARRGRAPTTVMMLCALGLESWLFVRSGRWTVSGVNNSDRRVTAPRGRRDAASRGGENDDQQAIHRTRCG